MDSIELAKPRALLVEDEALVALAVEDSLRMLGFDPVIAANGVKALAAMAQYGSDFAFVMLDVGLPDMRGDALAHEIRDRAPALPIILATGYDADELVQAFGADNHFRVLAKPYSNHQLRIALAELGLTADLKSQNQKSLP